jgi:hypothetical protein
MSFETLKLSEIKKIAEDFGVDIEAIKSKNDIIAALAEEGVTWSIYQKTIKDVADATEEIEVLPKFDAKKSQDKDSVLVRMERANHRYDAMGFTFTSTHPFVAMSEEQAQEIFDREEGFRLATPKEVQDFYN